MSRSLFEHPFKRRISKNLFLLHIYKNYNSKFQIIPFCSFWDLVMSEWGACGFYILYSYIWKKTLASQASRSHFYHQILSHRWLQNSWSQRVVRTASWQLLKRLYICHNIPTLVPEHVLPNILYNKYKYIILLYHP